MKTREEKIEEAKKIRDAVRKRVDRLEDISKEYGKVPSLRALEKNRRKYDAFDPKTHKLAIKSTSGAIKPVTSMTDDELDKFIAQGKKFMGLKTSTAKGAHASIRERTKVTLDALSKHNVDSDVIRTFEDMQEKQIGKKKMNDYLDKVGKDMKKFWDVVDKFRDKYPAVADKIINPNEYNDVFQEILTKLDDPNLKKASVKRIAKILAGEFEERANKIVGEQKKAARLAINATGGRLPETKSDDPFKGKFTGNNSNVYNNDRMPEEKGKGKKKRRKR